MEAPDKKSFSGRSATPKGRDWHEAAGDEVLNRMAGKYQRTATAIRWLIIAFFTIAIAYVVLLLPLKKNKGITDLVAEGFRLEDRVTTSGSRYIAVTATKPGGVRHLFVSRDSGTHYQEVFTYQTTDSLIGLLFDGSNNVVALDAHGIVASNNLQYRYQKLSDTALTGFVAFSNYRVLVYGNSPRIIAYSWGGNARSIDEGLVQNAVIISSLAGDSSGLQGIAKGPAGEYLKVNGNDYKKLETTGYHQENFTDSTRKHVSRKKS